MNVLGVFLYNEMRTGGHVRYLELMEGLGRRGNRVTVLMNDLLGYQARHFDSVSHPVRYRRKSFPPASWLFRSEAGRRSGELRERCGRPDVVIVFGETHLAAGSRLARCLGVPLVYGHRSNSVREALTYLEERGHSRLERIKFYAQLLKARFDEHRISRLADLAIFQSSYDRDDFINRHPLEAGRTSVVCGDIAGPRFRGELAGANRSESLKRIAFMGTHGQRKGIDYLVDAIIILASRGFSDLRFELCGPGNRKQELESRLLANGAGGMAVLRGRVPDSFPVLLSNDLLVVPSLFDSFPNSALEALHVGTPVIASRVGGIPEMLVYDELLFPPMDAVAIADRIERCVRDPSFYTRLRVLCDERREAFRFDWAEAWESAMARAIPRGEP